MRAERIMGRGPDGKERPEAYGKPRGDATFGGGDGILLLLAPASGRDNHAAGARPAPRSIGSQERAMKISARNVLKGTVVDIKKGATTAHVLIDVNGAIVTAAITNESVDDLKLVKGKAVYAVVKSSDVMVGVE